MIGENEVVKIHRNIKIALFTVIEAILFFVYYTLENGFWKNVLFSLITSLTASLLFYIISIWIFKDDQDRYDNISKEFMTIKSLLKDMNEITSNGLQSLKPKIYYDRNEGFWLNILDCANEELVLAGHSLSPWFKKLYKEGFINAVKRLANNDKYVKILLLNPDRKYNSILEKSRGGIITEKIQRTIKEINNIVQDIPIDKRKYVEVKFTESLSYMYIKNDLSTIISPYLNASESTESFLAMFTNDSKFAESFSNDIEKTFNESTSTIALQLYELRNVENGYYGHNWEYEDTRKYIFNLNGQLIEAGYFIHYRDKNKKDIVKYVIELPSSYGCCMKCKFCATSWECHGKCVNGIIH